jgi:hypothetical protein
MQWPHGELRLRRDHRRLGLRRQRRRAPCRITRLLQVLIRPPALFISLAIFVFLNIPSLGATYTRELVPAFWRFLNHFWIGAETTEAARSILYFGGAGVDPA